MSLILQALRRAHSQRQRHLARHESPGEYPQPRERRGIPWGMILGLLLVINAAALLSLGLREAPTAPAETPVAEAAPPATRPLAFEARTGAPTAAPESPAVTTADLMPEPAPRAGERLLSRAELPEDARNRLPALVINVHRYAEEPGRRIAVIDKQRNGEGDRIDGDLRVVGITRDGVVLETGEYRFLLSR
jgi:hypothetical protein